MLTYIFITIISFLSITTIVKAQKPDTTKSTKTTPAVVKDTTNKKDTVKHKKASLKIGLTYSSNSVYLGRTDSMATPYYGLGLTYTLKSGIFFTGAVN